MILRGWKDFEQWRIVERMSVGKCEGEKEEFNEEKQPVAPLLLHLAMIWDGQYACRQSMGMVKSFVNLLVLSTIYIPSLVDCIMSYIDTSDHMVPSMFRNT